MKREYKKHIKRAMDLFIRSNYADNFLPGQLPAHVTYYQAKLAAGRERYSAVSDLTQVPWQIIGVLHGLEARFDFDRQFITGEKWKDKTKLEPTGLGPWDTWDGAAVYGIMKKERPKDWRLINTCLFFEKWNGLGYYKKGLYTPYCWNYLVPYAVQGGGKYTSDGKYDPKFISKQVGAVTLLLHCGFFW